jgi:hypothetical protein
MYSIKSKITGQKTFKNEGVGLMMVSNSHYAHIPLKFKDKKKIRFANILTNVPL